MSLHARVAQVARPVALAGVAAFAYWYFVQNGAAAREALETLEPVSMVIALVLAAGYWVTLGLNWASLQRQMGGGLAAGPALRIWVLSSLARYVPGNIWHFAGRTAMVSASGGDVLASLIATTYEQVLTLAGALVVAGTLLPMFGGLAYLPALLALPAGLLLLHPFSQALLQKRIARAFGRESPKVMAWKPLLTHLGLYCLPNVPAGGALVLLLRAENANPVTVIGAFAFAWSIGYLSILTPSGLGVREITLASTLGFVGASAATIAIAHRVVLTGAELLLALVMLAWRFDDGLRRER